MAGRMCVRCQVSIDHRDTRSRHCSKLCRDRDYEGAAVGTIRGCLHCGTSFAPTKGTHVYCSASCRSRADVDRNREAYNARNAERRARERGSRTTDSFTRLDVLDRDGWICQLCLAPIDWNLTGRNPLAPSVDHVIPLIAGGDHSWNNVQAAHFGCNASKSDRPQPLLMGPPMLRSA